MDEFCRRCGNAVQWVAEHWSVSADGGHWEHEAPVADAHDAVAPMPDFD